MLALNCRGICKNKKNKIKNDLSSALDCYKHLIGKYIDLI